MRTRSMFFPPPIAKLAPVYKSEVDFTNAVGFLEKSNEYQNRLPAANEESRLRRIVDQKQRLLHLLAENGDRRKFNAVAQEGLAAISEWRRVSPHNMRSIWLEIVFHGLIGEVDDGEYNPSFADTESALRHSRIALAMTGEQLKKDPANAGARVNFALYLKRLAYLYRGACSSSLSFG